MADPSPDDGENLRLAEILDFSESKSPWQPQELAAVFRHQLSAPLALGPEGGAWTGDRAPLTFGELLNGPHPPVPLLMLLKDFSRAHSLQPNSPIPREIANLLYYAAIVAARIRCGQCISGLDDEALHQGIESMLGYEWLDESTRNLLIQGRRQIATSEGPK